MNVVIVVVVVNVKIKYMLNLSDETTQVIGDVLLRWAELKTKFFPFKQKGSADYLYSSERIDSVIGTIWWNTPHLVWLFATQNVEDYEGSQTQIGITEEGELMWQYQSHCSCNGYEDTSEVGEHFDEESLKSFNLREVPRDWENQIKENAKKLLINL